MAAVWVTTDGYRNPAVSTSPSVRLAVISILSTIFAIGLIAICILFIKPFLEDCIHAHAHVHGHGHADDHADDQGHASTGADSSVSDVADSGSIAGQSNVSVLPLYKEHEGEEGEGGVEPPGYMSGPAHAGVGPSGQGGEDEIGMELGAYPRSHARQESVGNMEGRA